MKRKLFDLRLYRSGLSQLRLAGTLFSILAVIATGLPCLFFVLQERQLEAVGATVTYPDFQSITILLVGVMILAPIALCLTLFGFLNHRNGSDFYHSVPQTRGCLFASFGAAALTWGYVAILLGVGTAAAVFGLAGVAGDINFSPLPYVLFTDLAGTTLLTAEMLLAMSVTGTVVTNFTVFGLLVFLPRFLLTVFANMLTGRLRFITMDAFGFFGNSLYNIPVSFFLSIFSANSGKLFTTAGPIWYTLALSVVCFAAAGVLFCRRRSESAGRSAPNRPLQHIYRCLIALPPSLIIPYTVVSWDPSNGDFMQSNLNMVITVTVVTLLVYFLFELISTKTPRNLLRAAPVFLAVVAFDVVFGAAVAGAQSWFLHDIPKTADIRSVTFEYFDTGSSGQPPSYNRLMVKRAAITDGRLTGAVAQALSETAQRAADQDFASSDFEYQVLLRLKNGRTMERKLYATDAEIQTIEGIKQSDSRFRSAQTGLPPEQNVSKITLGGLDANDAQKIWSAFRSEYATLTDAQKQQLVGTTSSHKTAELAAQAEKTRSEDSVVNLLVQGSVGLENYQSSYGITSLTPKTMALFIQTANRQNGPLLWSQVSRIAQGDKVSYGYSLLGRNMDAKLTGSQDSNVLLANNDISGKAATNGTGSAKDRQIMELLLRHRDDAAPTDISGPMAEIFFYRFDGQISYNVQTVFLQLSNDEVRQILALKQGTKSESSGQNTGMD